MEFSIDKLQKDIFLLKKSLERISTSEDLDSKNFTSFFNGINNSISKLEKLINAFKNYKVKISFIGHFSSGKSSLINAIIGYDLLDVDITPETDKAYEIFWSPEEIEEEVHNNDLEIIKVGAPQLLEDFKNVTLVDLPGLSADNIDFLADPKMEKIFKAHTTIVKKYINNADYLFIVNDATKGSLTLDIAKFIKAMDKPFVLILNKIDLVISQEDRENLKKHILEEIYPEKPDKIFFVSTLTGEGLDKLLEYIAEIDSRNLFFRLNRFHSQLSFFIEEIILQLDLLSSDIGEDVKLILNELELLEKKIKRIQSNLKENIEKKIGFVDKIIDKTIKDIEDHLLKSSNIDYWAKNTKIYQQELEDYVTTSIEKLNSNIEEIFKTLEKDIKNYQASISQEVEETAKELRMLSEASELANKLSKVRSATYFLENIIKFLGNIEKFLTIVSIAKALDKIRQILNFIKINPVFFVLGPILGKLINFFIKSFIKSKIREKNKEIVDQIKDSLTRFKEDIKESIKEIEEEIGSSDILKNIKDKLIFLEEKKDILEKYKKDFLFYKEKLEDHLVKINNQESVASL